MTSDTPLSPVPDYPAAHSMDTIWFAVDRDGWVARFDTGENGPVPEGWSSHAYETDLARVVAYSGGDRSPEPPADGADPISEQEVYLYEYEDRAWPVRLYQLTERPRKPLHLDQLPPLLRMHVGRIRFAGLRFADAPRVQPLARVPCYTYQLAIGYLCEDGRTVRPVPGSENEYRDFFGLLRSQRPDYLPAEWVFEGLSDDT